MDKEVRTQLSSFAKALQGPIGAIPLDRAIKNHLEMFEMLRESGATWNQITQALASNGARRPDGGLISVDHIRSAVTRQLQRKTAVSEKPAASIATTRQQAIKSAHKPSPRQKASATPKSSPSASTSTITENMIPSSERNASVLEKLSRTRHLRER